MQKQEVGGKKHGLLLRCVCRENDAETWSGEKENDREKKNLVFEMEESRKERKRVVVDYWFGEFWKGEKGKDYKEVVKVLSPVSWQVGDDGDGTS